MAILQPVQHSPGVKPRKDKDSTLIWQITGGACLCCLVCVVLPIVWCIVDGCLYKRICDQTNNTGNSSSYSSSRRRVSSSRRRSIFSSMSSRRSSSRSRRSSSSMLSLPVSAGPAAAESPIHHGGFAGDNRTLLSIAARRRNMNPVALWAEHAASGRRKNAMSFLASASAVSSRRRQDEHVPVV
ncbi:unnamed protein product [Amoebophrya sp. A120]|nr:unnamed protein product [Amoebophrya sp. A120]|eukprot:GSA120T00016584001.1